MLQQRYYIYLVWRSQTVVGFVDKWGLAIYNRGYEQ